MQSARAVISWLAITAKDSFSLGKIQSDFSRRPVERLAKRFGIHRPSFARLRVRLEKSVDFL
ncbi:hypothetical protein IJI17_01605 [Candidatus Saccharibacteria bacterium]|nr:hypothetical protein [Candidatus Saccharibacteria bacterium]